MLEQKMTRKRAQHNLRLKMKKEKNKEYRKGGEKRNVVPRAVHEGRRKKRLECNRIRLVVEMQIFTIFTCIQDTGCEEGRGEESMR